MADNPPAERFKALQAEYSAFYEIRNHPKPDVEYEDWKRRLNAGEKRAWAGRLTEQANRVFPLIAELKEELKTDRPYHELQSFFREDVRDLGRELEQYGFRPQQPEVN